MKKGNVKILLRIMVALYFMIVHYGCGTEVGNPGDADENQRTQPVEAYETDQEESTSSGKSPVHGDMDEDTISKSVENPVDANSDSEMIPVSASSVERGMSSSVACKIIHVDLEKNKNFNSTPDHMKVILSEDLNFKGTVKITNPSGFLFDDVDLIKPSPGIWSIEVYENSKSICSEKIELSQSQISRGIVISVSRP